MFVSAKPAGSLRSEVQLDQNAVFEWNIQISIAQMFSFAWQNICLLIFTPFQRWKHKANLFSHKRKRSNILFFSGVKVSEQKKSIFLVEKNCTRKKRKNPPEESEFFFFFYVWVVKLFLFSSTCVLPLESFQVGFFPICENSHTKKTRRRRRRSDKQHFFSCVKPKTSSRRWKKNLCNK